MILSELLKMLRFGAASSQEDDKRRRLNEISSRDKKKKQAFLAEQEQSMKRQGVSQPRRSPLKRVNNIPNLVGNLDFLRVAPRKRRRK